MRKVKVELNSLNECLNALRKVYNAGTTWILS